MHFQMISGGKPDGDFAHLSSASSYSSTCHGPTSFPISRMNAVASAISWASWADQEPPARMCVGAKNTREAESLCSMAALSRSASA